MKNPLFISLQENYKRDVEIAKDHSALVYYLYKNKNLTVKTKKWFYHLFFCEYLERYSKLNLFDLKTIHVEIEITDKETISTLKMKIMKRLWVVVAHGIQTKDFTKIKSVTSKN